MLPLIKGRNCDNLKTKIADKKKKTNNRQEGRLSVKIKRGPVIKFAKIIKA